MPNDETTIAQLKDRIAKTVDYLKSVKQSEIDGTESEDISITFPSGQTRQFTGQGLPLGNSLPNFWFHTTTAYDVVRQCGVEVGKRDFMGTPAGIASLEVVNPKTTIYSAPRYEAETVGRATILDLI